MGIRTLLCGAIVAGLFAVVPAPAAHGQDGFLFNAPQVQFTLRAGPMLPRAQSDIFDEITTELTLERRDFRALALGGEMAVLLGRHVDLAVGLGWAESRSTSDYAALIGADGLPIVQETRLRTVPLTATLRYQPLPRGRDLGNLAWLPTRITPYVGAGGGMTWYRLVQEGEFVDHETDEIFLDLFESRDHGLTAHAVAGLDYWISPRIGLNLEGRYTYGSAPVSGSYRQFDSMDLSGAHAAIGVTFRW